jgi:acetyl-CoA C-acetyltransferase
MPGTHAYIIAARRSSVGRVGGLHRARRIEDLAAPVLTAALGDTGLGAGDIDLLVVGNATAGGNPARLVSLVSGLPDHVPALTVDRQEASGLEAILAALRAISTGDAEAAVAGGAEALSMAPWRIAKPRSMFQTPRFIGPADDESGALTNGIVEATNALARRLGISRAQQDHAALAALSRAEAAREARRLTKEIVPLRSKPEEARDELSVALEIEDLEDQPPLAGDGTATALNTSQLGDGAAFVVAVSDTIYDRLGRPPALRLLASASTGAGADDPMAAPVAAVQRLARRIGEGTLQAALTRIELAEASAAQAIAIREALGLDDCRLNPEGGQLARGMPMGAAGAILVVRLFTGLVRTDAAAPGKGMGPLGLAVTPASGGQALAAVFERVGS